jgi:hypothetical protein
MTRMPYVIATFALGLRTMEQLTGKRGMAGAVVTLLVPYNECDRRLRNLKHWE